MIYGSKSSEFDGPLIDITPSTQQQYSKIAFVPIAHLPLLTSDFFNGGYEISFHSAKCTSIKMISKLIIFQFKSVPRN